MNFVSSKLIGGLGNQLFQIAMVIEYAKNNNKIPIFKEKKEKEIVKKHEKTPFSSFLKDNLLIINYDINFHNEYQEQQNEEYKKTIIPYYQGNLLINGYFQSPYNISDDTRIFMNRLLYSNKTYLQNACIIYNNIKKKFEDDNDDNYCFLHFRRGDFLNYNFITNLDYYINAVNIIGIDKKLIIFSDDIKWCNENIKINDKQLFINNNEDDCYLELILMSLFKNGVVSPGSSFSYWGAYIGNSNKKIVVSKYLYKCVDCDEILNKHNERYLKEWIEI
jgi:hypothetical protein